MSDYLDQVFDQAAGGKPATDIASKVKPKSDYLDEMFGGDTATRAEVENSDFMTDLVTGSDRNTPAIEGLPEITPGDVGPQVAGDPVARLRESEARNDIAKRWLIAPDDEARANLIKEYHPDAAFSFDEKRNVVVDIGGKKLALNRPGLSPADVREFFGEALLAVPAARATRAIGAVGRRMLATGAGEAGTMAARQQISPDADTDFGQILGSGLAGTGGEAVGSVLAGYLRKLGPNAAKLFDAAGAPTDLGRKFFERIGIDVSIVTPDLAKKIGGISRRLGKDATEAFAERADAEASDAVAGAARQAQASEFGIPLTRGQATGDIAQQRLEDTMRRGGRGSKAADILGKADTRQREALGEAQAGVSERFGLDPNKTRQDAASGVAAKLDAEHQSLSKAVDTAYERLSEVDGAFDVAVVASSKRGMVGALKDASIVVDPALTPNAIKALQVFDRMMLGGAKKKADAMPPSVQAVERYRQYLNSRINATEKLDRVALIRMKGALDEALDDAFDKGLMYGDEAALATMKEARRLRAELGRKFNVKPGRAGKYDSAGKFLERAVEGDVSTNDMAKWLYGSGVVGEGGRAVAAVKRLKEGFGADSEIVKNVREGAFWHAIYGARDKINPGDTISVDVMYTNLSNALSPAAKEYMGELFTGPEMATLRRLQVAVFRAKNKPLSLNNSGTGASIEQAVGRAMGILGKTAAAATAAVTGDISPVIAQVTLAQAGKQARTQAGARGARAAVSDIKIPLPPPKPVFPAMGTAAITGVGAATIDTIER